MAIVESTGFRALLRESAHLPLQWGQTEHEDQARDGEQTISADDAVHRMREQFVVAGARRMHMPEDADGDIAQEQDDGNQVKQLQREIQMGTCLLETRAQKKSGLSAVFHIEC